MIITSEKELRVKCSDVLLFEADYIISQLDYELRLSALNGRPGIGLAAPQIGIDKKAAIIRLNDELKVDLINPVIVKSYNLSEFDNEGCLSFPDRFEKTMRYQEILVKNDIEPKNFIATGLFAVVIQHEIDHLQGKLLPDFAIVSKTKIRPNDICKCGSGKKYKRCCGQ